VTSNPPLPPCSSSPLPSRCTTCLLKGGPCQPCPSDTFPLGDVDQCISCATKHGSEGYSACKVCATISPNTKQKVSQCLGCVDKARKVACPSNTTPESRNFTCADLTKSVAGCSACAAAAANFTSCERCIMKKPYSQGCGECTQLKTPAEQSQCYTCIATNKVVGTGCSSCVSGEYFKDNQLKRNCLTCLADQRTSLSSKTWCVGCQNYFSSQEGRVRCAQCLAQNPGDVQPCFP
jgi:hypothetical protein